MRAGTTVNSEFYESAVQNTLQFTIWTFLGSPMQITLPGSGTASLFVSAVAGLGKYQTGNAVECSVDICIQPAGGAISAGSLPLALVFEGNNNGGVASPSSIRSLAVVRQVSVTRAATYTVGMCFKTTSAASPALDRNSVVKGFYFAV
jgi:hypothetical protein